MGTAAEAACRRISLDEDDDELDVVLVLWRREDDNLEVEVVPLAHGDEEVEEGVWLPAVEVDAVLVGHESFDVTLHVLREDVVDVSGPVDVVVAAAALCSVLVVAHEVLEVRDLSVSVEGSALVRKPDVEDTTRLQDPFEFEESGDRVLEVLEQMVGDHEVE